MKNTNTSIAGGTAQKALVLLGLLTLGAVLSQKAHAQINAGLGVNFNNGFQMSQTGNDLLFRRSGATYLRWNTSGKFGIALGNSLPGTELTVDGIIRASNDDAQTKYIDITHGGTNSYINHVGEGNMDFRHGGTTYMQLTSAGKFGIGGNFVPTASLEVRGDGKFTNDLTVGTSSTNANLNINGNSTITGATTVGASDSNADLTVYGQAKVQELQIDATANWADYVFADDYQLRPLEEVASYIQENKHLPEVMTAEEVAKHGYAQSEVNETLLRKIEELTLYMIEMKADNEALKQDNAELRGMIKQLQTQEGRD
ncbi:MAG: hypothetical protein AAFQ98_00550 [Bacteroidota bacterium]